MALSLRSPVAGPVVFGLVYFIAAAVVVGSTRFQGGVAFLWIATGILTARLVTLHNAAWRPWLVAAFVASVAATAVFGIGVVGAIPLAFVNVGEAVIGALLLRRFVGKQAVLESLRWLAAFVLAAGVIAPLIGGAVGGLVVHLVTGRPYFANALTWYSGHALGTIAFMPVAMMVVRGEVQHLLRVTRRDRLIEQAILLALVAATSIGAFAQNAMPLLFLPMLPIILATFCGGMLATAGSIVILAVVGGVFTALGHGPIGLTGATLGGQMQFLQFYLATTMLTILPATAELQRRAELFRRLRDSEARYRLVTDNSTDIILNSDAEGRIIFASPSIRQLGDFDADAVVGRSVHAVIHPDDHEKLRESRARIFADPSATSINEYRVHTSSGELRWLEAHSRAVVDADGTPAGLVSAIRDVTERKANEDILAHAARTDALTGLANRRAFEAELAARIASGIPGCVAVFDLDHFKQVNDRLGHAAGDAVLQRFAALARASIREQDFVARVGGEEFAVVLPDTTREDARLICDRLRSAVADGRFDVDARTITVTVSGGVAPYGGHVTAEAALRDADAALYRAKSGGRDRLTLAA